MYVLIIQLWVDALIPVFQALDLVAGYVKARLRETPHGLNMGHPCLFPLQNDVLQTQKSLSFLEAFSSKQSKSGSQKWGGIWEGFFCIPLCLNFKKKCFLA